jgi:SAM-dependent methyltransferase
MEVEAAEQLLTPAVPAQPGVWADFGAGDGTFTRALAARLGGGARIYAVDRDVRPLARLERELAGVMVVRADLEQPFELPGVAPGTLDGVLVANTLHFMREPAVVLGRLASWLRPQGTAVVIEYDRRSPSRWVPHPVNASALPEVFRSASLTPPSISARTRSRFGGEMYVAVGQRP